MKKRIAILLVISVLFSVFPVIASDKTYTIKTAQDFMKIKNDPEATYILAADITLPLNYEPIDFRGSLIGDNETDLRSITVYIDKPGSAKDNGAALFSYFRGKGSIRNIRLKGSVSGDSYVAGFIAQCATGSGSTITNVVNEATIRASGSTVAGILAKADANIYVNNVCNLGNIYGGNDIGGICGNSSTNTFYLCRNYGNITSNGNYCGGITGNNYAIHDYCFNSGNITGVRYVGGIVGLAIGNRNMSNLYNTGEITSTVKADDNESGGILGGVYPTTSSRANITNSVSINAATNTSGDYSPIYPSYTPASETNYIKAENCFYYSKELTDDGKEGTEAVDDEKYHLLQAILDDIDAKFTAVERETNIYLQDEVLSKVGARAALFVGNNKAIVRKEGKAENIRIDSESVNVVPVIKNSITMVPIGFVARMFDCSVNWNSETKSVGISGNGNEVILYIGSDSASINGKEYKLSCPAYIENGRTMVPLRSVSELLNKYVFWDNSGLILLSDSEINPSEEYLKEAVGLYLCSPYDLTAKLKTAEPGDTFIIANGTYKDAIVSVDINGTENAPITIKAQTPGGVELTGTSRFIFTGNYLSLKDIYFNECRYPGAKVVDLFKANYFDLSGCYFYKSGSSVDPMSLLICMRDGSSYNKIHHNTLERAQSMGIGIVMDYSHTFEESNHDNHIYSNYFLDSRQVATEYPGVNNGLECIAMGASWGSPYKLNNVIEYNRFENIYGDGGEGICLKTSGNIVRYNTFVDSTMSGISGRYGDDNIYEGNFLFNVKSGSTIFGHGNLMKNNYIYSPMRDGFRTYSCPGDSYGIEGDYQAVHDTVIEGNIYIDAPYAAFMLGDGYNSDRGWINIPSDNIIRNNTIFLNKGAVLRDYASFNTTYENNTVTLRGSAVMGDAKEGFTEVEDELVFDGEIYLPKSRLDFDKTGLISFEEAGPENRWWEPLLRCRHFKYFDHEPEKAPLKITPSATSVVLNDVTGFDLRTITITAEYDAPELYSPKFDNISCEKFSFKVSEGFTIKENTLVSSGGTKGTLTITYKGVSCDIPVKSTGSTVSELSDNFDTLSEKYINKGSQKWEIVDGKLTNTSGGSGMIINYGAELKGDYEISCDVTLKKKNDTADISGGIVVGYTETPEVQYTALRFAPANTINAGIYNCDWYWSEKKSETTIYPVADKTYHIVVRKSGDDLVVLTDGVVTSVYDNGKNLEGKFGFITYGNIMTVDNLKVKSISEVAEKPIQPLELFVDRIDTISVNVGIKENVENAVYYRVFRQGTPVSDSNEASYYSDLLVRIGKEYNYAVKAYDEYGNVVGEGSLKNILQPAKKDEFFEITNLYLKTGTKEIPYRTNVIRSRNRGLNLGIWAFFDRQYAYLKIPDYLKDAGYIKTANSHKAHEEFLTQGDDWMKFDINRSATVYVLSFHIFDTPDWLKDWKVDTNPGFEISGNPVPQIMYSKHFDVEEGKTTTVTLGGFKFVNVMYLVFVKPDVMPEYVELKKINGSVA